jgi:hypothetical protein
MIELIERIMSFYFSFPAEVVGKKPAGSVQIPEMIIFAFVWGLGMYLPARGARDAANENTLSSKQIEQIANTRLVVS